MMNSLDKLDILHSTHWPVWIKLVAYLVLFFVLLKGLVWATLPLLLLFVGIG